MQDERAIFNEITELFGNPSNMQNDITEAYGLMRSHIHKKYIQKVFQVVENCEKKVSANPPPEIKLLNAIKPFTAAETHDKLDDAINIFKKFNTVKELRRRLDEENMYKNRGTEKGVNISAQSTDSSVHDDGVYDIDAACRCGGGNSYDSRPDMRLIMAAMISCAMK